MKTFECRTLQATITAILLLATSVASSWSIRPGPVSTAYAANAGAGPLGGADTPSAAAPLDTLLNPDGTLDPTKGFSGSLDPTGLSRVSWPGEPPRFTRESAAQAKGEANSKGQTKPEGKEALLDPRDEIWDDRFTLPGANDYVYAAVVSGTNLYLIVPNEQLCLLRCQTLL